MTAVPGSKVFNVLPMQDVTVTVKAGGSALVVNPDGTLSSMIPTRAEGDRVSAAELIIAYLVVKLVDDPAWVENFILRERLASEPAPPVPEPTVPGTGTVN